MTDTQSAVSARMLLHWSPRSPFVRKLLIAAEERGLRERLDCVRTVVHPEAPHEGLLADNPLSKLPTLVLADGTSLYDSRVICEYFDTLGTAPRLFPQEGAARFAALRDQSLGDGILDFALVWLVERAKAPQQQSAAMIAACHRKLTACLDRLETDIGVIDQRPFDIGHLSLGAALLYLDFRFGAENWRANRPALTAWHASFAARPSVIANPAVDD
jgi:glutathione S-transferase